MNSSTAGDSFNPLEDIVEFYKMISQTLLTNSPIKQAGEVSHFHIMTSTFKYYQYNNKDLKFQFKMWAVPFFATHCLQLALIYRSDDVLLRNGKLKLKRKHHEDFSLHLQTPTYFPYCLDLNSSRAKTLGRDGFQRKEQIRVWFGNMEKAILS